jgi:hypothetical protein
MGLNIDQYVEYLLSQQVYEGELDDNIMLFIDFIKRIYKKKNIAIFTFSFLEKIDEFIISSENIPLIQEMFDIILEDEPAGFDIISSGNFGKWILKLVEEEEIKFDGNIVVTTGSIRKIKKDENNIVDIIQKRFDDISNKNFIFMDDSYFAGGTRDRISEYLNNFNSKIKKSYVFYTHNLENPNEVFSFYCYSENHSEEIVPIHNYIEHLNKIDLSLIENIIWSKIDNDEISNIKELINNIKELTEKVQEKRILNYKKFIIKK